MSAAKMVADSTQEDLATDHPTKTKRKKGNEKKTKKSKEKKGVKKAEKKRTTEEEDALLKDPDLDLATDVKDIGEYVRDREEMLNQMFHAVKGPSLQRALPDILKRGDRVPKKDKSIDDPLVVIARDTNWRSVADVPVDVLKQKCLEHLEVMSKKRIRGILSAGMEYKRKWRRLNAEVEALAQADSDLEDSFYQNSPPTASETVHHGPGEFESDQEQLLLDSTCGSSSSSESDFSLALEEISDDECALTDDSVLSEEIATWASQHNCTRSSINHVLDLFRKHGHRVPKDSRTLLQTPRFIETKEKCGGQFLYLGIETGLLKLAAQNVTHFKGLKEVLLNFNIDGVPLFKSTNGQLWPILCSVCNFEPFVIAVYYGKSKPSSVEDYLSEFLLEVKNLCDNGITLGENVLPLKVNAFVCDAPARSFLKCIKAHNAYFSCERCCVRGSWQGRVVFDIDLENAPPRNEETFNKLGYSDHQVKRSPLVDAGVSCIASFALDYMHLVCLGVVKRILSFLKNGPRDCKLSQLQLTQLSHNLCSLNGKMPRDFARQPRSIFEVDRWKATEFRQFLLYTGPLVLRSVVSSKLYNHFLTLSVALSILLDSNDCTRNAYISYAEELLLFFVQNGKDIYGPTFTSYNVHSLIHLADDVKHFGKSLNDISAFQFENYLHKLKKNVRKAQNPISQVAKRIAELERSKNRPVLKFVGSSLSTKKKDSCVLLKNHNYAFVIERRPNKHFVCDVISQSYLHNFFESPCNSKLINIAVLKPRMLSKYAKRLVVNVEEIDKKAVCLPFDGSYLLVPMLHTFERH